MSVELNQLKQELKLSNVAAKTQLAALESNPPTNVAQLKDTVTKIDALDNDVKKKASGIGSTMLKIAGAVVVSAAAAVATAMTGGLAAHVAIPVAAALVEKIFDKGVDAAATSSYKSPTPFSTTPRPR